MIQKLNNRKQKTDMIYRDFELLMVRYPGIYGNMVRPHLIVHFCRDFILNHELALKQWKRLARDRKKLIFA